MIPGHFWLEPLVRFFRGFHDDSAGSERDVCRVLHGGQPFDDEGMLDFSLPEYVKYCVYQLRSVPKAPSIFKVIWSLAVNIVSKVASYSRFGARTLRLAEALLL